MVEGWEYGRASSSVPSFSVEGWYTKHLNEINFLFVLLILD